MDLCSLNIQENGILKVQGSWFMVQGVVRRIIHKSGASL